MSNTPSPLITILFLLSVAVSAHVSAANNTIKTGIFSKIYAFGDSFTDTGNTRSTTRPTAYVHVSNPPYGINYFHHPTNRYSDGRIIVDFLANSLSLPFLPPYLNRNADFRHGVNFAVAGSTANDYEFFVKNNMTLDLTHESLMSQLSWFDEFLVEKGCRRTGSPECGKLLDDALFWVGEIGGNDYAYSFDSTLPKSTIQEQAIEKVTKFLKALLDKGAKYVVVQGLPLTGCLPLAFYLALNDRRDALGCVATANNQSYSHNKLLQAELQQLRTHHPKAFISYADFWNAHRTVMENPAKYGFIETFKTCCGSGGGPYNFDAFATCGGPGVTTPCADPSKYVNWDGVHLTEAFYRVTADLLLRQRYSRPSFQLLLHSKMQGGRVNYPKVGFHV